MLPAVETTLPPLMLLFTVGVLSFTASIRAVAVLAPTATPIPSASDPPAAVAVAVAAWVAITEIAPLACALRVSLSPV